MTEFAARLLAWYDRHGRRDLPWQVGDPYRVWVSEIMLQQTQVQTVIPYYERFIERFPDVGTLADAPVDDVLRLWSGLGYYARARNLHKAAQVLRDDFDGTLPRDIDALQTLPGIGRSTAGAILSLAFDQRHAILDGNAKRVYARHAAIDGWPGKTAVVKRLWAIAEACTPAERAADYTQAIMDLGATLCTRSRPACGRCPVSADCRAYAAGTQAEYPGRKPKKAKPVKSTTMVLAVTADAVYLERRPASGIWGGLWSLPELDAAGDAGAIADWCRATVGADARHQERWCTLRHSFSHYDLDIEPVVVRVDGVRDAVADGDDARWHHFGEAPPGGLAAPVQKLINELRDSDLFSLIRDSDLFSRRTHGQRS